MKFNPGDRVRFDNPAYEWHGREGVVVKTKTLKTSGFDGAYVKLDNLPRPKDREPFDGPEGCWLFRCENLTPLIDPIEAALTEALAPLFSQLKTGTSDKSS